MWAEPRPAEVRVDAAAGLRGSTSEHNTMGGACVQQCSTSVLFYMEAHGVLGPLIIKTFVHVYNLVVPKTIVPFMHVYLSFL